MDLSDNEKYLRDLLGDGTEEVDLEEIWEAVEPRLKKKKKKRFFFWWFFGIGLLSIMLYLGQDQFFHQEITTVNPKNDVEIIGNISDEIEMSNEISVSNVETTELESRQEELSGDVVEYEEVGNTLSNNDNSFNINFYNLINPGYSGAVGLEEKIIVLSSNSKLGGMSRNENDILSDAVIEQDEINNSKDEVEEEIEEEELKSLMGEETEPKKRKDKKKRKKKRKKLRFQPYLSMNASVGYPVRILSSDGSFEGNTLLDLQKEYEQTLLMYGVNSNLRYIHTGSGLILNVGLSYDHFTERLKYNEETTETELQSGVTSMVLDGEGNIVSETQGQILVTTITKRKIRIFNQYNMFSLPLGIGYRQSGKKINWDIEGGVDVNLFFQASGKRFGTLEQLSNMTQSARKGSISPNIWGSLTMNYSIKENLFLTGSLAAKQQLGTVNKKDYPVKQKYFMPSLSFGLSYLLE